MNTYKISGHTLHTNCDCPAIPNRNFDWSCIDDNYDGAPIDYDTPSRDIIGTGKTELEAIYDWIEQYLERDE